MSSRSTTTILLILCALPALGFDVRTPDRRVVASFYFACPGSEFKIPARVRTKSYATERLEPRTAAWQILEFEKGMPPDRKHKVVGEVEVLAQGSKTTLYDLHEKAKAAAEKMGGDALVDIAWRDAGRTEPKIGQRGHYVLTAKVARWEEGIDGPIIGK